MEHYIVRAVFQDFFAHLKAHMKPADRVKLCLVFKDHDQIQDIHLSTVEEEILSIVRMKYEIHPGKHPYLIMEAQPGSFTVLGNKAYAETKP